MNKKPIATDALRTWAEIAEVLPVYREEAGIKSQEELADRAGMDRTTVLKWERSKSPKPCSRLAEVGCVLGLRPDELMLRSTVEREDERLDEDDEARLKEITYRIRRLRLNTMGSKKNALAAILLFAQKFPEWPVQAESKKRRGASPSTGGADVAAEG